MRFAGRLSAVVFVVGILAASVAWGAANFVPVPDIEKYLTPENMAKLEKGEMIKFNQIVKDQEGNDRGKGVALILVHASKDKIMAALDSFETYPTWMPNTNSTKVVLRQGDRVDVEFDLTVALVIPVHYTVIHKIDKGAGTIQWRMDDSKPKKHVKDSTGAWVIKPLDENKCVVAYTVSVDTGAAVPKSIQDALTNTSLPKVVKAVRERVEGKQP